jgi:hypothetical protein
MHCSNINISLRLLLIVLCCFPLSLIAQRDNNANLSLSLGSGVMYYNGDLSDSDPIPDSKLINPYIYGEVSWLLIDRLDMSLGFIYTKIEGADSLTNERDNQARNLSFNSPYAELNLQIRLSLLSVKNTFIVNPYLLGGIGGVYFNPKAELDGIEYELQPMGTEGQFIPGGQYEEAYSRYTISANMGGGINIRINDTWKVRVEAAAHFAFTDYLDDVSTVFPDSLQLSMTPNGPIAVGLSSKRPRGYPKAGRSRGNPENKDVVLRFGLSIVYILPAKTNKPAQKPGVMSNTFKGKKGWWGGSKD